MAFLQIPNVKIAGIASCVPKNIETVADCHCLSVTEALKFSAATGIEARRIAGPGICTSDLCFAAAERLLEELNWDRSSIEALVFVTQTPDYVLPSTAPLLQHRLGLNENCLTLDISLGCSGYVYGLSTLAALLSTGSFQRALLLVGDTITKICSIHDKSTYPLFGDAGSATALTFDPQAYPIFGDLGSDGSGFEAIIVREGGCRNPLKEPLAHDDKVSNSNQLVLSGMDVFSFGINQVPAIVRNLLTHFSIGLQTVDYFIFHQANKLMNEKIREKLAIDPAKVPYSLRAFGNTSSATIPLTLTTALSATLGTQQAKILLCGFGVGLSWGALYLETNGLTCPPLIEI